MSFGLEPLLFLASASGLFLAHAPLSRLLRIRAGSPAASQAPWWRLWLTVYLLIAALAGLALLFLSGLWELCLIGALAGGVFALHLSQVRDKAERAVAGEVIGIAGLTATAPASALVAGGRIGWELALLWGLCFLYFSSSIFYVKMRVSRYVKKEDPRVRTAHNLTYHLALTLILLALWSWDVIRWPAAAAFLPAVARAFWYLREPQGRLNLRRIGYSEIAFTLWFVLFMIVSWR